MWTSERALDDGAEMTLVLGAASVALPSELERRGSRVALTARAPAAMLARYGSERRPTLVIADRRDRAVGSPDRTSAQLRRPPADPRGRAPDRGGRSAESPGASRASIEPPVEADPDAGQGWFCVETAGDRKQRTSACHRTSAECDESRAALRASGNQAGVVHSIDVGGLLQLARRRGPRTGLLLSPLPLRPRGDKAERREGTGSYRSRVPVP